MSLAVTFVVALLVSWVATKVFLVRAAAWGFVDVPNERSMHAAVRPRGGGVGVVAGVWAGLFAAECCGLPVDGRWVATLAAASSLAAVGLFDDRRGLGIGWRLMAQLAVAVVSVRLWLPHLPLLPTMLLVSVGVGWYNAFNFMDGLDGFAVSEAMFLALGTLVSIGSGEDASVASCVLAAGLGFFFWNRPPARVFMGDCGSLFFGALTFSLLLGAMSRQGGAAVPAWLIMASPFVADAGVTLLRRVLQGERFWLPHRSHAYQRLARRWGGHRPVLLGLWFLDGFLLLLLASLRGWGVDPSGALAVGVLGVLSAAAFFAGAGKSWE